MAVASMPRIFAISSCFMCACTRYWRRRHANVSSVIMMFAPLPQNVILDAAIHRHNLHGGDACRESLLVAAFDVDGTISLEVIYDGDDGNLWVAHIKCDLFDGRVAICHNYFPLNITNLCPFPSEKKVFPVSSAYLAKQDVMNCSPSFSSSMVSRTATISRISSSLISLYSMSVLTAFPSRVQVTVKPDVPVCVMVPLSVVIDVVIIYFSLFCAYVKNSSAHMKATPAFCAACSSSSLSPTNSVWIGPILKCCCASRIIPGPGLRRESSFLY